MSSPTQLSLDLLRHEGYQCAVVEKWIPKIAKRSDLWHFADLLAVHARDGLFLLCQVTTAGHVAARLAKVQSRPEALMWLRAGGKIELHGWSDRGVRRVEVHRQDLAAVVLSSPRPRRQRRGERQLELFPT